MIYHWGEDHNAYLRGRSVFHHLHSTRLYNDGLHRSLHNIRIERLWRDVRKDTSEVFRQIFFSLEERGLLDQENQVHRLCLFLVFSPRIQASLDRTIAAWNNHKIRTARSRTPIALFELSREVAIRKGYWTGDPGDQEIDAFYGCDGDAPLPPQDELDEDPVEGADDPPAGDSANLESEEEADLEAARSALFDMDFQEEDNNWGIDIYC